MPVEPEIIAVIEDLRNRVETLEDQEIINQLHARVEKMSSQIDMIVRVMEKIIIIVENLERSHATTH